jgi:hypothetical protein
MLGRVSQQFSCRLSVDATPRPSDFPEVFAYREQLGWHRIESLQFCGSDDLDDS